MPRTQRGRWFVLCWIAVAAGCGPAGAGAPPPTPTPIVAAAMGYRHDFGALVSRFDAASADGDRLLAQRDANPMLSESAVWLQEHAGVVSQLQQTYQSAGALIPPVDMREAHDCIVDGFRLTYIGHNFLHNAFLAGGHGAYYMSAHGNWDLELGMNRVRACRGAFT